MSNTTSKPKIQKTNRILIRKGTIYCSSKIAGDDTLRKMLTRLEQKLVPLKGEGYRVEDRLRELAQKHPDHFPYSAHALLDTVPREF